MPSEDKFKVTPSVIKSLGELFRSGDKFSVSYFQRDYSWDRNEWSKFWEDIITTFNEQSSHFFGFMCFLKEKDGSNQIIEGQQRIVTTAILLCVVRDMLIDIKENEKDNKIEYMVNQINQRLVQEAPIAPPSKTPSYILELSTINNDFFRDILNSGLISEKMKQFKEKKRLPFSNDLIKKCYEYFYDQLKSYFGLNNWEKFGHLLDFLLKKWYINIIEVDDLDTAYKIFITLNARGLDLTISDLIKAYLLQKTFSHKNDFEYVKSKWESIVEIPELSGRLNEFLRHFWLSSYEIVKEEDLFKKITEKIKNNLDVIEFIDNLTKEAEVYSQLLNPLPYHFDGDKLIPYLLKERLFILSQSQVMPILLSLKQHFRNKDFKESLLLLESFIFRYLTIGERENKEIEKLFSNISIKVRNKEITSSENLKSALKESGLYINDEEFKMQFANAIIKNKKTAIYILKRIEEFLSGEKEKWSANITLEHILPRNPEGKCLEYVKKKGLYPTKEYYEKNIVPRLGNMTLLLEKPNKMASNKLPKIKAKEIYSKHTKLKINEDLKEIEDWTDKEINQRQQKFAEYAVKVWKL